MGCFGVSSLCPFVELLKFGETSGIKTVAIPSEALNLRERVETVRASRKDKRQSRPQT